MANFGNTSLAIANDPLFKPALKGEKHVYRSMSTEDKKRWNESYRNNNKQPYHSTVKRIEDLTRNNLGGLSPWTTDGFDKILSNESLCNQYVNLMANDLFKSNETWKRTFVNTVTNSFESVRNDREGREDFKYYFDNYGPGTPELSAEGVGAMATYQNRNNFSGMLAFGIAGWFGRSKILELYHPVENNTMPEFSFEYILEYALHPVTKEKMPLPLAWRTNDLFQIFDLPNVKPLYIDESQTPHIMDNKTKIKVIDKEQSLAQKKAVYKDAVLGDGWIKAGSDSNLILDSASDENSFSSKDSLEPTVAIDEILYIATYEDPTGQKTPVYKTSKVDILCQEANGQQNVMHFNATINLTNIQVVEENALKDIPIHKEKILGEINLDTGDFLGTTVVVGNNAIQPRIVAFKVYAKVSDTANQRPGLEHQTERFRYSYRLEYTNFGHIPITPYVMDNWNLGNDSLAYVATMTDFMTKSYSITRDLKAEMHLINDFEKPTEIFPLYLKLGGYFKEFTHDFALTGPVVGEDPYQQSRYALRERIIRGLSTAETSIFIPQSTPRQWILFGPDRIVQAFPTVTNYSNTPDGDKPQAVNASGERFGFNIDEAGSIIDSLGRNVKIIGCIEQRWVDRDNIIGGLKSTDMKYPTFLYYAYMFRIFTGIDPEYRNLSGVLFFGRDGIFSMLQAHTRIYIMNFGDDLYELSMASAKERTMIERG